MLLPFSFVISEKEIDNSHFLHLTYELWKVYAIYSLIQIIQLPLQSHSTLVHMKNGSMKHNFANWMKNILFSLAGFVSSQRFLSQVKPRFSVKPNCTDSMIEKTTYIKEGWKGKYLHEQLKYDSISFWIFGTRVSQNTTKVLNIQYVSRLCQVQSLILSGKNILQELLSREVTTIRHDSFIKNLHNLDANLYSDRQSPNFLTPEIMSNLNLPRNGSYAAKSIECSNYKQGRNFSFIKQVLNKIIQFLPLHV